MKKRQQRRIRLHRKVRRRIQGTGLRPRLSVFRSNMEIYAQLIDDVQGHTLVSASSRTMKGLTGNKVDRSREVGKALARMAKDKGLEQCVFDRGGYLYHGRVKALAEGAREGGLKF